MLTTIFIKTLFAIKKKKITINIVPQTCYRGIIMPWNDTDASYKFQTLTMSPVRDAPPHFVSLRLLCESDALNKLGRSTPARLLIDSRPLIERGTNQFFSGTEMPRVKLFLGKPFGRLAINLTPHWHLFAGDEMPFGLSLSISGVVLLGLHGLVGSRRGLVFVFCVQICLCLCECGVIGPTMLAHPYRVTY